MNPLLWIPCGLAILGILSAYLIIQLPKNYWLKWLLIPLLIFVMLEFGLNIKSVLGYPYGGYPVGEFSLVGFRVVSQAGGQTKEKVAGKPMIEFLVSQHGKDRLYIVPFDPHLLQQLAQLGAGGGRGKFQGRRGGGHLLGNGEGDAPELATIEIPRGKLPEKDDDGHALPGTAVAAPGAVAQPRGPHIDYP